MVGRKKYSGKWSSLIKVYGSIYHIWGNNEAKNVLGPHKEKTMRYKHTKKTHERQNLKRHPSASGYSVFLNRYSIVLLYGLQRIIHAPLHPLVKVLQIFSNQIWFWCWTFLCNIKVERWWVICITWKHAFSVHDNIQPPSS